MPKNKNSKEDPFKKSIEQKLKEEKEKYSDCNLFIRYVTDSENRKLIKWQCPKCNEFSYETNLEYFETEKENAIFVCHSCCIMWY